MPCLLISNRESETTGIFNSTRSPLFFQWFTTETSLLDEYFLNYVTLRFIYMYAQFHKRNVISFH